MGASVKRHIDYCDITYVVPSPTWHRWAFDDVDKSDLSAMWQVLADHTIHNLDRPSWSSQGANLAALKVLLHNITSLDTEDLILAMLGAYVEAGALVPKAGGRRMYLPEEGAWHYFMEGPDINVQCDTVITVVG